MQICIISIVYWHFYTSSCPVASQCSNNVVISCLLTIHPFECLFSCHLIQTARWRYWRFLNPYHYLSQQDFAWLPLSDASFCVKNRGIRRLNSDKAWKSEEWLNPTLTSNAFSVLFGVGIYELRNGYHRHILVIYTYIPSLHHLDLVSRMVCCAKMLNHTRRELLFWSSDLGSFAWVLQRVKSSYVKLNVLIQRFLNTMYPMERIVFPLIFFYHLFESAIM